MHFNECIFDSIVFVKMRIFLLLLVFVGLLTPIVWGQTGHYFQTHYKPGNDNYSALSVDIQQDANGILYFANRSGILQFDGRTWTMVPTPAPVYAISIAHDGAIYAAGSMGFGYIGLNRENQQTYLSLSDSIRGLGSVLTCKAWGKSVYFLNEYTLLRQDSAKGKPVWLLNATSTTGLFTGLFEVGRQLFVNTQKQGLMRLDNQKLIPAEEPLGHSHIVLSEASPDGSHELITTQSSHFFMRRDSTGITPFLPADSVYLRTNVIVNAAWITDQMIALGTLRGGVIFIDAESGQTYDIINYYSGLPDNQVYALLADRHRGVWAAHDYGFTRIAPFLPFRTFSHYRGLEGSLLCVQAFNDQLYVGTTLGLFRLTRQEFTEPPALVKPGSRLKAVPGRKTVDYTYERVAGISGKADQLVVFNKKLLCGGVGGVFEVNGLTATSVDREPVRNIYYSRFLERLLLSTFDNSIKSFQDTPRGWQQTAFPDSLSMHADFMFEDHAQNLWICSRDKAIKIGIEEGEILDTDSIPLPQRSEDKTVGLSLGQEVYLTQNGSFYHYASFKNAFIKYDSLPDSKKYFASAGYFWFFDGTRWRTVDRRLQGTIKTEWLKLFPDIRFMAPAEYGRSLWVITGSNELYRFSSEENASATDTNPLFLKEVRGQQQKLPPTPNLRVEEGESALTFEFIQPEYVSLESVEYRYFVKGLQTEWSSWSSLNNVISFPFLPPGTYQVQVQSKDLFGKITELDTVEFNVLPPYWKRWWFYAFEFIFFGALVVGSMRLRGASTKYRFVHQFFSALTIIMLIQFIQTMVAANISLKSTPVAEFFVQVFIALLVLPLEEFLRRFMLKAAFREQHHLE